MSLPTEPYIQILQGHDGMQGPPGAAGTPGRDGNNCINLTIKGIRDNQDHQNFQDKEMEVLSLLDGDVPPILLPMIQNYFTEGRCWESLQSA